jgi:hypothetical protein
LVVRVVAVIVAEVATVNSASALAGTSPSIQNRTNARIAAERAGAPPVATPGSLRLDWLMIDRDGVAKQLTPNRFENKLLDKNKAGSDATFSSTVRPDRRLCNTLCG